MPSRCDHRRHRPRLAGACAPPLPLLLILAASCLPRASAQRGGGRIGPEWTPIDVSGERVTLCVLDFKAYHADPPRYPMFRDLVAVSRCHHGGGRTRSVTMAQLRAEHARLPAAGSGEPGAPLLPSGFVFHESRCGSTLIANMLASSAHRLQYTESSPLFGVVGRGVNEAAAANMRTVVAQMGRATGGVDPLTGGPMHTRLFFKLQSALVHHIPLFQLAFPATPWIFVFRTPVEVMVSHIGARLKRGNNAPCLRSRYSRDPAVLRTLAGAGVGAGERPWARKELWCAGHLATLCRLALAAADKAENAPVLARVPGLRAAGPSAAAAAIAAAHSGAGSAGSLSVPVFVEHATLVRTMLDYVLPRHFRTPLSAAERAEILHVTKHYSKDRGGGRKWKSDSAAKREDASAQLKSAAAKVLLPFYAKLKRRVPRLDPA